MAGMVGIFRIAGMVGMVRIVGMVRMAVMVGMGHGCLSPCYSAHY